jgi:F-type H+-transporting ATPase subunit b
VPDAHFISPLLFWSTVSFLVLLFLMYKFAFPEIFRLLEERERKIRGEIDEAERARSEAQQLLAQYEEKLKGAAQEVQGILEEARQQARRVVEEGQKKMERESQRMVEEAKSRINREQQQALREIQRATVELTLSATEKILERKLTEPDNQRFVEAVIREIAQAKES